MEDICELVADGGTMRSLTRGVLGLIQRMKIVSFADDFFIVFVAPTGNMLTEITNPAL